MDKYHNNEMLNRIRALTPVARRVTHGFDFDDELSIPRRGVVTGQAGRAISERDQQELDYYTQLHEQLRDSGIDSNAVVHELPEEDLNTYYEIEDKISKKVYGEDE